MSFNDMDFSIRSTKATLQDLFDISVTHILRQGTAAIGADGICAYRAPDGKSCAAAPFITNYKPLMENTSFTVVAERFPDDIHGAAKENVLFVKLLQQAHDEAFRYSVTGQEGPTAVNDQQFIDRYKENVQKIAWAYGLVLPVL